MLGIFFGINFLAVLCSVIIFSTNSIALQSVFFISYIIFSSGIYYRFYLYYQALVNHERTMFIYLFICKMMLYQNIAMIIEWQI